MKTTIYFMRHGESEANVQGVYAGDDNTPMTEKGRVEAAEAARTPGLPHFDRIISSDLDRAKDSAVIVAKGLNYDVEAIEYDPRLREVSLGQLVGKPAAGLPGYLEAVTAYGNPMGVELLEDATNRLSQFLAAIAGASETILVVGHNGSGLIMQQLITGSDLPLDEMPKLANAQIVKFGEIGA